MVHVNPSDEVVLQTPPLSLGGWKFGANAVNGTRIMNDTRLSPLEPELLSIRKLAKFLDCSPKTIQDWVYKDRKRPTPDPLPYYKLGGLVRFRLKEVMAWIERRKVRISSFVSI